MCPVPFLGGIQKIWTKNSLAKRYPRLLFHPIIPQNPFDLHQQEFRSVPKTEGLLNLK